MIFIKRLLCGTFVKAVIQSRRIVSIDIAYTGASVDYLKAMDDDMIYQ